MLGIEEATMKREWTKYDATLEARAYEYAIRVALRKCGLYLRARSEAKVIGLRLPDGAAVDVYREALRVLLKATEALDHYHVATVALGRRGETFSDDAREVVRMRSAVVVMIEYGSTMPFEFELAFDRIVTVDPLRPAHLMSAAREAWKMDIGREDANTLVRFPPALLFAALRRGRPVDVVLSKLAGAPTAPKTGRWEPRLEELEGYGEARIWGEALVSDMADWRSGRISWRDVDAGLLLSGPPGTGKTLFAAALARSCEAHFIGTSSAQWQSKGHLGDMLGAMRRTFREARDHTPTILFIDEIDSIGDRRSLRGDNADYGRQVVNALLELLDGSETREGVVVIAASNYPDKVDSALRRPGRLDRHIAIGLPDQAGRAQMLAVHLGSTSIDADALKEAARSMSGYSGALIAQVARDARRVARRKGREAELADILAVVPPLAAMDGTERWETCVHEAGHVIVGLEFGIGTLEFIAVACEVGHLDQKAGHVQWKRPLRRNRTRQSYLDELAMIMAGMAAEKVVIGDILDGSGGTEGSDLHRASDLATLMTVSLGLGALHFCDVSTPGELDRLRRKDPVLRGQVEDLLAQQLARATRAIQSRRMDVEALAGQLMEREIMSGQEVSRILNRPSGGQSAA
jgi:cell division protease FtsH